MIRRQILRYTSNQRTNHWLVAIFFLMAALSGLALFHPALFWLCLLYTSPSPRDGLLSRMPSSA